MLCKVGKVGEGLEGFRKGGSGFDFIKENKKKQKKLLFLQLFCVFFGCFLSRFNKNPPNPPNYLF